VTAVAVSDCEISGSRKKVKKNTKIISNAILIAVDIIKTTNFIKSSRHNKCNLQICSYVKISKI
jgi:hypothetical protein